MSARKKTIQVAILLAIVIAVFLALKSWGTAGDCSPNEVDGQCGMSTAFGEISGVIAGGIILLGG